MDSRRQGWVSEFEYFYSNTQRNVCLMPSLLHSQRTSGTRNPHEPQSSASIHKACVAGVTPGKQCFCRSWVRQSHLILEHQNGTGPLEFIFQAKLMQLRKTRFGLIWSFFNIF